MEKCCFCGKEVKYGNNALPMANGYCCDSCNILIVLPQRFKELKRNGEKKNNRKSRKNN